MKKILLATTVLAASAGYAAAGTEFAGSAAAGIHFDGSDATVYNTAKLSITMSGETDSGLTFGATTAIAAGTGLDGFDLDGPKSGTLDAPEVFISGAFGKIAFKNDGQDHLVDDDEAGDLKYSGTFGGVSADLVLDVDESSLYQWSAKLGYSMDAISASLAFDDADQYDVSVSYTMGAITATVATDEDSLSSLKLAYAANGISGSVKFDTDNAWEVEGGYSANGVTAGIKTNDASEWEATASYDLGGGLSVVGGVNHEDKAYVGASMSF